MRAIRGALHNPERNTVIGSRYTMPITKNSRRYIRKKAGMTVPSIRRYALHGLLFLATIRLLGGSLRGSGSLNRYILPIWSMNVLPSCMASPGATQIAHHSRCQMHPVRFLITVASYESGVSILGFVICRLPRRMYSMSHPSSRPSSCSTAHRMGIEVDAWLVT